MKKLICFCFFTGALLLCIPSSKQEYVRVDPIPIVVQKVKLVKKSKPYAPPIGKVLEIAQFVSHETNYPVDIISKIMWAESQYDCKAKHYNTNKTTDYCLFQINSSHLQEAKKMGLDVINNPDDNAQFAIYLMKKNGLADWSASKDRWN